MKDEFALANHKQSERGQSTIEFALTIGFVLVLLVGFVDLGRAIYAFAVISEAAQEGARFAVTAPSNSTGIQNAARSKAIGLSSTNLTVTTSFSDGRVSVTVGYTFRTVTPLLSQVIGRNGVIQLSNTARMIVDQ